jgi:aryl hydrocarbon receptor nuclear translocator-like protein 1
MKCKNMVSVKEEHESSGSSSGCRRSKKQITDKKFCVVQCTGYLKSWAPAKIGVEEQEAESEGDCNLSLSCLVAVGRLVDFNKGYFRPNSKNLNVNTNTPSTSTNTNTVKDPVRTLLFTSRHAMDGKFLFVDQRATLVLGFLPQELLGTSMYEYFNHKDISALAESHKVALQSTESVMTRIYGLRTKHSGFIPVQSEWKAFKNPWTKDVEFLIAKNNVILADTRNYENPQCRGNEANDNSNYDFFHQCE